MAHVAELIAVGDEVLSGSVVNSDAQTVSQALFDLGIEVRWHTVVGDCPERLREALDVARKRADILITMGGLGPTQDDLTRETTAAFFGKRLVFHPEILEEIRCFYERTLRCPMPENNRRQAELPEDCVIFANSVGTAPGCGFEAEGVHVLMLPGPPRELIPMLNTGALPYLRSLSQEVIVSHDLMTFGMGESAVEELLRREIPQRENPILATYAKPAEVRVRLTARAKTTAEAEALLAPELAQVREVLGDIVYGQDVAGLEEACLHLLKEKGLTFATAESCTGGQIAQRITALPGASGVYRGGVVSYWTEVKASVLGVPQSLLDQYGAVSEPTARSMAQQARAITGAELAVSVTGVAGPDKDERGVDVGIAYIGLATPEGTWCRKMDIGPHSRSRIQAAAANHAFDLLRRYLTGLPLHGLPNPAP